MVLKQNHSNEVKLLSFGSFFYKLQELKLINYAIFRNKKSQKVFTSHLVRKFVFSLNFASNQFLPFIEVIKSFANRVDLVKNKR